MRADGWVCLRTVRWRGLAGPSEELIHMCMREPASREVHVHQRHTEKTIIVFS